MYIAEAAEKLVAQLTNRFPAVHLMDAFGLIYLQYWSDKEADVNFDRHLKILKEHYRSAKPFSTTNHPEGQVEPMLSPTALEMLSSLFKQCMKENSASMLKKPFNENPVTRMWRYIDANSFLQHSLSEFIKVAEIRICLVLGSVQDERTFSCVTFMKTKVRNRLTTHLSLMVGMKTQSFYNINTFPYDRAYNSWRDCKRNCNIG
jgi:hypothetical protein